MEVAPGAGWDGIAAPKEFCFELLDFNYSFILCSSADDSSGTTTRLRLEVGGTPKYNVGFSKRVTFTMVYPTTMRKHWIFKPIGTS